MYVTFTLLRSDKLNIELIGSVSFVRPEPKALKMFEIGIEPLIELRYA